MRPANTRQQCAYDNGVRAFKRGDLKPQHNYKKNSQEAEWFLNGWNDTEKSQCSR
jgi:hypothetical protein